MVNKAMLIEIAKHMNIHQLDNFKFIHPLFTHQFVWDYHYKKTFKLLEQHYDNQRVSKSDRNDLINMTNFLSYIKTTATDYPQRNNKFKYLCESYIQFKQFLSYEFNILPAQFIFHYNIIEKPCSVCNPYFREYGILKVLKCDLPKEEYMDNDIPLDNFSRVMTLILDNKLNSYVYNFYQRWFKVFADGPENRFGPENAFFD